MTIGFQFQCKVSFEHSLQDDFSSQTNADDVISNSCEGWLKLDAVSGKLGGSILVDFPHGIVAFALLI